MVEVTCSFIYVVARILQRTHLCSVNILFICILKCISINCSPEIDLFFSTKLVQLKISYDSVFAVGILFECVTIVCADFAYLIV